MVTFLADKLIKNSHDTANPEVREKYGVFAGMAGVVFNVILCSAKIIAGILSGMVSMIADGANNLSDAGSSVITMVGFKLSGKKHDADHPFGHGRIEYVTGFIVSIIILFLGLELIISSVEKLLKPEGGDISIVSLVIMGVAILVKLYMYTYNHKIAKKISSESLKATATDCIADCIASAVVLACALLSYFTGINVDGWAGLAVSLFIIYAGIKSFRETVNPLLGSVPDKEYVKEIEEFVLSQPLIEGLHDLIVHDYGHSRKIISFHAEISDTVGIHDMHDAIDNIEVAMHERFGALTVIHADPIAINDPETVELKEKVTELVRSIDERYSIHDFRLVKGETHSNLIFDVVITSDTKLKESEIKNIIKQKIKTIDPKYNAVMKVEYSYLGE